MKKLAFAAAALMLALSAGPVLAQKQPERSSKGAEVRGKERAAQVRDANDQKKSAQKEKREAGKAAAKKTN
jgi:hypothetical protein